MRVQVCEVVKMVVRLDGMVRRAEVRMAEEVMRSVRMMSRWEEEFDHGL